jgi:hypothetical protein
MDTAKPPEQDDLDLYEPEGPEEAARLDAEAEAAFEAGQYVPHERVAPWLQASSQALNERKPLPPRPKTEAQLARECDQNHP